MAHRPEDETSTGMTECTVKLSLLVRLRVRGFGVHNVQCRARWVEVRKVLRPTPLHPLIHTFHKMLIRRAAETDAIARLATITHDHVGVRHLRKPRHDPGKQCEAVAAGPSFKASHSRFTGGLINQAECAQVEGDVISRSVPAGGVVPIEKHTQICALQTVGAGGRATLHIDRI